MKANNVHFFVNKTTQQPKQHHTASSANTVSVQTAEKKKTVKGQLLLSPSL